MVLQFQIVDSSSGKLLSGNLIIDRMGESIIFPFVDGKADVALNGIGNYHGKIGYEVWVLGYVPMKSFLIGVYPRTIEVKLSKIGGEEAVAAELGVKSADTHSRI
jgi:hypothetical protein